MWPGTKAREWAEIKNSERSEDVLALPTDASLVRSCKIALGKVAFRQGRRCQWTRRERSPLIFDKNIIVLRIFRFSTLIMQDEQVFLDLYDAWRFPEDRSSIDETTLSTLDFPDSIRRKYRRHRRRWNMTQVRIIKLSPYWLSAAD